MKINSLKKQEKGENRFQEKKFKNFKRRTRYDE